MSEIHGAASDKRDYELPNSVWQALTRWGMVLEQDKLLPSVSTIIAGGPLNSSWWGHPAAKGIYEALQALEDHTDVVAVKLLSGRVTFVLQRLWPALVAVARAREAWQLEGLDAGGRALLELADSVERVRLDTLPGPAKALRESARQLERRLLVHGGELHTESGAHTKVLESWDSWAAEHWPGGRQLSSSDAKAALVSATTALNTHFGARAILPWQTTAKGTVR